MSTDIPLIMLPGMAADDRLLEGLRSSIPSLRVPAWIEAKGNESLSEYANSLARTVSSLWEWPVA
jgi:hypothetical protein